jgi:hypothetical protein
LRHPLHFVEPPQQQAYRFLIIIDISFILRQTTIHSYVTELWSESSVGDAIAAAALLADQFVQLLSLLAARTL